MKAIQLSLWGTMPEGITPMPKEKMKDEGQASTWEPSEICPRETINTTMTLDPCPSCPLREVCGDDCGMKLYDIDSDGQEDLSFTEWLSEPLY